MSDEYQREVDRRDQKTIAGVFFFYLLDTLFLWLFALQAVVPMAAPVVSLTVGIVACATVSAAIHRGMHLQLGNRVLVGFMTTLACLMFLSLAAWLPQVGFLMLMSVGNVIAASALRFRIGEVLVGCAVASAATLAVLVFRGPSISIPRADLVQQVVSAAWIAMLLVRAGLISLVGMELKLQLSHTNRRLADALFAVEQLANQDELTGLMNRRSIRRHIGTTLAVGLPTDEPIGIALMDIDRFKQINDSFGHAVGDDVLKQFARVVETALRTSDQVARWGGEEFLLVTFGAKSLESSREAADRLRKVIESYDWSSISPRMAVTASMGVTVWREGETADEAINRADKLLYQAKERGRNRVCAG